MNRIKIGKKPEQKLEQFITKLNTTSVATRYPDDPAKIQAAYTKEITKDMITKSKDVLKWFKINLIPLCLTCFAVVIISGCASMSAKKELSAFNTLY
ncbi:MAG: HEPN domain-containing protein, partial [Deltaproteobacteria bacterium]|nr:HEPN domain-containing protein [Deltaproteobacteria bacterium]